MIDTSYRKSTTDRIVVGWLRRPHLDTLAYELEHIGHYFFGMGKWFIHLQKWKGRGAMDTAEYTYAPKRCWINTSNGEKIHARMRMY